MSESELLRRAAAASFVEDLFDRVPDVVFFIKDLEGRYVVVNRTLMARCGLESKSELLGHTTEELFPAPLGRRYLNQDLTVCRTGNAIVARLELHLYPSRTEGWCLTDKSPVFGSQGEVIGLVGISRDLRVPSLDEKGLREVAAAVAYLEKNFDHALRVEELAAEAGLSLYQLNRRIRGVYGITPSQLIAKTRLDNASRLLRQSDRPIGEIAVACGFFDQSAFSRLFKSVVGLTPTQYRARYSGKSARD